MDHGVGMLKTYFYQNKIPTLGKPSRISKLGVKLNETINKALQVSSPISVIKLSSRVSHLVDCFGF